MRPNPIKWWWLSGVLIGLCLCGCQGSETAIDSGPDAWQDGGSDASSDPGPADPGPGDQTTDAGWDAGQDAGSDRNPSDGGGDQNTSTCQAGVPVSLSILDQHEMLIVTNDALYNDFDALAEWKRAKGVPTEVVSTTWIGQNVTGADLPAKIRGYISQKHDTGLSYVLLGGDSGVVPPRIVHSKSTLGGTDDNFASDFYYSDLQDTWDGNGNGTYGEVADGLDMHPEVAVGRDPANNPTDVQVFVARVLAYEQTDPGDVKNALFISEDTGTAGFDSAVELDPLANTTFPADFDKEKLYWKYQSYPGAQENTLAAQVAALNAGKNFVTHYGHSSETDLNMEMTVTDVANLVNSPHFPVYVTCGCLAGRFDYSGGQTAGEVLLTNPSGGAVAYLGNANLGLGPIGGTAMISAFYKAIFAGKLHLGEALDEARNTFYSNESSLQSEFYGIRWTQLVVLLLGDPEMPARTQLPKALSVEHAAQLGSGEQCLEVLVKMDGAPLAGATVVVYRTGKYLYRQQTDASGKTMFRFQVGDPGQIQVTATLPETIPALSSVTIN